MTAPRAERLALALLTLGAVVAWAAVPTYPNYDAYYHLVWGRDLLDGIAPGFETYAAPTQHPLYLALAALLSPAGEDADRLLVLVTVLSLVALTGGAYALGRTLFGAWPGVLAALCVGSSFAFALYAVRAYVDVPFLALVVWAGVLEARRPRRGIAPMGVLAVAGLLRPEAWVLAGAYWLWCLPRRPARARLGLLVLAAAAPVAWALVDLAVTGDPLFSVHATSGLAEELGRERGLGNVPRAFVEYLADVTRPPVAAAGALGIVLALRRFGTERMAVPLALLGAGALTFVGTGILGLSILPRYLTVPAVALCVLAGYGVMGFTTIEKSVWRERWRRGAIAALVLGAAFVGLRASSFDRLRDELRFNERTHEQLAALLEDPRVVAGIQRGGLTFPTYRVVPDARWILGVGGDRVAARTAGAGCGGIEVYVRGSRKEVTRFGEADGVRRRTNRVPRGAVLIARRGPYLAFAASGDGCGVAAHPDAG
ncbi:MAG: hypothetical protein H0T43_04625 [Solirubrobacterales bacterium]|nr:hypothetical protein [Solirubrobacterales bacterium]